MPFDALKLKRLREKKGWTQAQAAAAAGLPVGTYRDLEQGVRLDPGYSSVLSLAAAFGVDCGAFADQTPVANEPPEQPRRGRPPADPDISSEPPAGSERALGKRK